MSWLIKNPLKTYNAFGLITLQPEKVLVSLTVITVWKIFVQHSVTEPCSLSVDIFGESKVAFATLALVIEEKGGFDMTVSELTSLRKGSKLGNVPEVMKALKKTVALVRKSAML